MCELLAMSSRQATRLTFSLEALAGRTHVFAHNGHLPGIEQPRNFAHACFQPVGGTDSEHAFCALMQRLSDLWRHASVPPPVEARLAVVAAFATDLRKLGPANFLYADGEVLFAHGHRRIQFATGRIEPPGLFMLSRQCSHAHESVQAQGLSIAPGFQEVTLIASVPLSSEPWRPLAEGEIVAVSAGRLVARRGPSAL